MQELKEHFNKLQDKWKEFGSYMDMNFTNNYFHSTLLEKINKLLVLLTDSIEYAKMFLPESPSVITQNGSMNTSAHNGDVNYHQPGKRETHLLNKKVSGEQYGRQKGVLGIQKLWTTPKHVSEGWKDLEEPGTDRYIHKTKEQVLHRSLSEHSSMSRHIPIYRRRESFPSSASHYDADGALTLVKETEKKPLSPQDFLKAKLSQKDLNELKAIYSDFLVKTRTDIPENIVRTRSGTSTKKIYITYQDDRQKAERYMKSKFPIYYKADIFVFQQETNQSKLAGAIVISSCTNHCQQSFGTESCYGVDGADRYIVSVKHTIDQNVGAVQGVTNKCLEFSPEFTHCQSDSFNGYYGGLDINGEHQLVDVAIIKMPIHHISSLQDIMVTRVDPSRHQYVEKTGVTTHTTNGFIIDYIMSENINGQNCQGIFVVADFDATTGTIMTNEKFADLGDSGALVKAKVNNQYEAIGVVYKTVEGYEHDLGTFKHATYCLRLDAQVEAVRQMWQKNLQLYESKSRSIVLINQNRNG